MGNEETRDRLPDPLPADPVHWADGWLKEAIAAGVQRNPNAMTVVSIGANKRPSARVVLCKYFVPDPGYVVFFTNYRSQKSRDFDANPAAAAVFHWDAFGRQIRIEGEIVRSPDKESDEYFASRDWGSKLGAWGSDQSEPVASRETLVRQIRERGKKLGLSLEAGTTRLADDLVPPIPRPPHWGGLRLWPNAIELWVEGPDRIHDRGRWTRNIVRASEHTFTVTPWRGSRLQP